MKRTAMVVAVLALSMLIGAVSLQAQQPPQPPQHAIPPRQPHPPQPPQPPMDPMGDVMFPPDLIMGHTRELNITDEQKTSMRGDIQKTTTQFLPLQWQLQDAMEALHQTMKMDKVDEQQALAQLEKVLDTERQIKRLHFSLGIRLKNQLTSEQQEKLRGMRMFHRPDGPPPPQPARPARPAEPTHDE